MKTPALLTFVLSVVNAYIGDNCTQDSCYNEIISSGKIGFDGLVACITWQEVLTTYTATVTSSTLEFETTTKPTDCMPVPFTVPASTIPVTTEIVLPTPSATICEADLSTATSSILNSYSDCNMNQISSVCECVGIYPFTATQTLTATAWVYYDVYVVDYASCTWTHSSAITTTKSANISTSCSESTTASSGTSSTEGSPITHSSIITSNGTSSTNVPSNGTISDTTCTTSSTIVSSSSSIGPLSTGPITTGPMSTGTGGPPMDTGSVSWTNSSSVGPSSNSATESTNVTTTSFSSTMTVISSSNGTAVTYTTSWETSSTVNLSTGVGSSSGPTGGPSTWSDTSSGWNSSSWSTAPISPTGTGLPSPSGSLTSSTGIPSESGSTSLPSSSGSVTAIPSTASSTPGNGTSTAPSSGPSDTTSTNITVTSSGGLPSGTGISVTSVPISSGISNTSTVTSESISSSSGEASSSGPASTSVPISVPQSSTITGSTTIPFSSSQGTGITRSSSVATANSTVLSSEGPSSSGSSATSSSPTDSASSSPTTNGTASTTIPSSTSSSAGGTSSVSVPSVSGSATSSRSSSSSCSGYGCSPPVSSTSSPACGGYGQAPCTSQPAYTSIPEISIGRCVPSIYNTTSSKDVKGYQAIYMADYSGCMLDPHDSEAKFYLVETKSGLPYIGNNGFIELAKDRSAFGSMHWTFANENPCGVFEIRYHNESTGDVAMITIQDASQSLITLQHKQADETKDQFHTSLWSIDCAGNLRAGVIGAYEYMITMNQRVEALQSSQTRFLRPGERDSVRKARKPKPTANPKIIPYAHIDAKYRMARPENSRG